MMAHGYLCLLPKNLTYHRAGKLSAVNLFMCGHQAIASQRVVMLPAGQRPHFAHCRVAHAQTRTIALPPNHALVVGRCHLAALQQAFSIRIEDKLSVVERSFVSLVHTQNNDHLVRPCRLRNGCGHWPRNLYRLFVKPHVFFTHQHRRHHKRKVRIIRHKSLRKDNQLHTFFSRRFDCLQHFLHRARATVQYRRDLYSRRFDGTRVVHSCCFFLLHRLSYTFCATSSKYPK